MKKNLLSVLILALLVVNIVLNVIMMVSVLGTNGKTAELVSQVVLAMNLELYEPGSTIENSIPLSQTDTYSMNGLMVQLKHDTDENGKAIGADYIMFDISLSMNTKNKDYKTYGTAETLAGFEIQMRDAVESVIKQYTEKECQEGMDSQIKAEILRSIQNLFQSDFIYRVSISGVMYQ